MVAMLSVRRTSGACRLGCTAHLVQCKAALMVPLVRVAAVVKARTARVMRVMGMVTLVHGITSLLPSSQTRFTGVIITIIIIIRC